DHGTRARRDSPRRPDCAVRNLVRRGRAQRAGRSERDGARYRDARRCALGTDGPAQGPRTRRVRVLYQRREPQGRRDPRQPARSAAVPLEVAAPPDPHRGPAGGSERPDGRRLLRLTPSGFAPRLGRFRPVAAAGFAAHLPRARRDLAQRVSRRRGAAPAPLDRLPPGARADRVLALAPASPARAAAVHPYGRRVGEHAAVPVNPGDARLNRSAAFASIALALFLSALKAWALARTGSTAMLGSLAD